MVRLLSTAVVAATAAVAVSMPELHGKHHFEKDQRQVEVGGTTDGKYFDHVMIMMFENHAYVHVHTLIFFFFFFQSYLILCVLVSQFCWSTFVVVVVGGGGGGGGGGGNE